MHYSTATTALVALLASSITTQAASTAPKRTYSVYQKFTRTGSTKNIAEIDRARRVSQGLATAATVSVSNAVGVLNAAAGQETSLATTNNSTSTDVTIENGFSSYYIYMGVGEPVEDAQQFYLLVDTGSANTWINATKAYVPTASAVNTGNLVGQNYGIGQFRGYEYIDTVSFIGEGDEGTIVAKEQGIGAAFSQESFDGIDGILGLAPAIQTAYSQKAPNGTVLEEIIPTVVDTLYAQDEIPAAIVGLSLIPTTSSENPGTGTVTFGGVSYDDFVGSIKYFPKEQADFIAPYWGFSTDSLTFDTLESDGDVSSTMQLLNETKYGIVDSGSTLVTLPGSAFATYMAALPGSYVDSDSGLLLIPAAQVPRIGNMTITLGDSEYVISPSAQLFPNELVPLFGLTAPETSGYYVSVFGNAGPFSESFTLGMFFLDRYYAVFDTPNQRIGLAYTEYTFEKTTELTSFRRAKRAHRNHEKRHEWSAGKARLNSLKGRSPFVDRVSVDVI